MSSWSERPHGVVRRPAMFDVELRPAPSAGAAPRVEAAMAEGRAAGWAAGYAAGQAEGLAAGRRAGEEAARAEVEARAERDRAGAASALAALAAAVSGWEAREASGLAMVEDAVVDAALALAEAVVGRELAVAADPGRDALVRALALAPDRDVATARLHPDDLAALGDVTDLTAARDVTLVADARVERGGCLLDAGNSRIDAQLGSALARVAEVLRAVAA